MRTNEDYDLLSQLAAARASKPRSLLTRVVPTAAKFAAWMFVGFIIAGLVAPDRFWTKIGDWSRRLGMNEFAVHSYTKAIHLNASNAGAFNSRGVSYYNSLRLEAAIEDYTKALALDPNYGLAMKNRALARLYLGEADGARKDAEAACERGWCLDTRSICSDLFDLAGLGEPRQFNAAVRAGVCAHSDRTASADPLR